MRGVILAAGRGRRMGSLTEAEPKCFSMLGGRRLLDWQLRTLASAGIDPISIVTGYLSEAFDGSTLKRFHNPVWAETQMVQSLFSADAWLRSAPCIVSYSDIIYEWDAVRMLDRSKGDIAITYHTGWRALWEARFGDPLIDAETFRVDEDGTLLEIGRRPESLDEIDGQFMGLLKFTPEGYSSAFEFVSKLRADAQKRLDMTSMLSGLLEIGHSIEAVPVSSPWYEIDSESDWRLYRRLLGQRDG